MSGPVPVRVDGAAKAVLLDVIDGAVPAGWSLSRICDVSELDRQRAWRWQQRRTVVLGRRTVRTRPGRP